MQIEFKIKETKDQIINDLIARGAKLVQERKDQDPDEYELKDEDFYSSATIKVWQSGGIEILTAWSGFEYYLFDQFRTGRLVCSYTGAYKGLLAQNLLPTITPAENLLDVKVVSQQLGEVTIKEYIEFRNKLQKFYEENDCAGKYSYAHPRIIFDLINKG